MRAYKLTGDYPLKHDGRLIEPGETVEMDEDVAEAMVAGGRLVDPQGSPEDGAADDGPDNPPDPNAGGGRASKWLAWLTGQAGDKPAEVPAGDERRAVVTAVIRGLDRKDQAHFTQAGVPDARVISEKAGFEVSAAERDEIWAAMAPEKNT